MLVTIDCLDLLGFATLIVAIDVSDLDASVQSNLRTEGDPIPYGMYNFELAQTKLIMIHPEFLFTLVVLVWKNN